jgi:cobalt-zinc-cadmium efflux system membrane fusion protein
MLSSPGAVRMDTRTTTSDPPLSKPAFATRTDFLRTHGPTIFVLALLVAVGAWGVATGWKAPKFSELWKKEEQKPKEEGIALSEVPENASLAQMFNGRRLTFPSETAARRAGLKTAPTKVRDLSEYITANGVIDYNHNRLAHLSTRVQGIVYRVEKHAGQSVKKNELLALVESPEVGKAKAEFLQGLVLLDIKKKIYERLRPSVVPESKIQQAETELSEARIRLVNAQQTLTNLGLPVSADALLGLPQEKLPERVRLLGLEDRPDLGNTTSSNLIPLRAPFDGLVISRDMVEGEVVSPQQVQFTIADLETMWIILDVRLEDTPRLAEKEQVRFVPDSVPDLVTESTIQVISTEVDAKTRTVSARSTVDNKSHRLRARTFGTGRIRVHTVTGVVAVPEEAVQSEDDVRVVFVRLSPQEFEARVVRTGVREAGFVQVQGNLKEGDQVVTVGSHALKSEILKNRIGGDD